MAIHAYDEDYLSNAQNILGHAADFAIMTLGIEPSLFGKLLAVTKAAKQFADGNPRYIAGMNGCEVKPHMLESTCFLTWQMPWAALGSQTWSSADTRFP